MHQAKSHLLTYSTNHTGKHFRQLACHAHQIELPQPEWAHASRRGSLPRQCTLSSHWSLMPLMPKAAFGTATPVFPLPICGSKEV